MAPKKGSKTTSGSDIAISIVGVGQKKMLPAIHYQRTMTSDLSLAKYELLNAVEGMENKEACRDNGRCQPGELDLM
ncbi:hypothetical protein MELB17_06569 [Marinobacter sp. ELB17]|nr:hypothetical protein MELB17_06569 [Marinobacter sp. ELB17]